MEYASPLISVIIPVYNVEKYLRPCLDSIIAQTYTHFEVLLVNDGSTDTSGVICDEYAAGDPRFCVFHKENGGVSAARNLGMSHARGEYIAFVDSDDLLTPDCFEVLYEDIVTHGVQAAFCSYALIDEQSNPLPLATPRFTESKQLRSIDEILDYTSRLSVVWGCLLPAQLTKQHCFSRLRYGEDSCFMFDLLCNNFPIYVDTRVGYLYLQRNTSATATKTVSETVKLRDHLLVHAHRYNNLPSTSREMQAMFLSRYALAIHNLAYVAAQPENKEYTENCKKLIAEHIQRVLPLSNQLPIKLRLYLLLYAYVPSVYSAYARFNECRRRNK